MTAYGQDLIQNEDRCLEIAQKRIRAATGSGATETESSNPGTSSEPASSATTPSISLALTVTVSRSHFVWLSYGLAGLVVAFLIYYFGSQVYAWYEHSRPVLWLKADAGVMSDNQGHVLKWADQSGHGNDALQNDPFAQPMLVNKSLNGKSVLHFNGTSQWMRVTDTPNLEPTVGVTVIAVYRHAGPPSHFGEIVCKPFFKESNWHYPFISYEICFGTGVQPHVYYDAISSPDRTFHAMYSNIEPKAGVTQLIELTYDGSTQSIYLNSTHVWSQPVNGALEYGGGADLAIGMLSPYYPDDFISGDVAEVLIFDHALSDTERQSREVYLSDKYGIYNPNATWPKSYSTNLQALITLNQWNKDEADACVTARSSR